MFRNYLKTTFRSLLRYKGYTLLNLLGLSIGLASSLLIIQYVLDELSYDDFHEQAAQIYRVRYDYYHEGNKQFSCASTYPGVGPAMKESFPEVEEFGRMMLRYGGGVIRQGDRSFKEHNIFMVEQQLFELFSYEVLQGEVRLDQPNTAVMAEEMVAKYFGTEDPIGKRIQFGAEEDYEITAVIRSPEHSHLKFHFMFSYPSMEQWGDWVKEAIYTSWGWYDFYTYLKLRPGTDIAALEAKFPDLIRKYTEQEDAPLSVAFQLQPLTDIHLYSNLIQEARVNGNGTIVYVLLVVALFILLIAWINYINLATARAMERAKEVGIRKVVGALRTQLIRQFVLESVVVNFVAAVLAVLLVEVATPFFNELAGKSLSMNLFANPLFWLALLGLFLLGAFFSGLYPAFVLSAYKPVTVLKGAFKHSSQGIWLRRGLVGLQFFFSIFLIAGTLVVYQQISYMRNQDLGIDIEQTLVVNGPGVIQDDSVYSDRLNVFKTSLEAFPHVERVAASTEIPGNLIYWTNNARRLGDDADNNSIMYKVGIDYDYVDVYGHKLLGRNFDPSFGTDEQAVIMNEQAVKALGFAEAEAALGQRVKIGGDTLEVIGVMEDYHQEGLKKSYDPIAFLLVPNARTYYSIKIRSEDVSATTASIQQTYQQLFPENPFDYVFLDDFFNEQYRADQRFGNVLGVFAFLAILVACLGLLGLASFSANQRRKEISIRKVLGSSVGEVLLLLSREYVRLVVIAAVFACASVAILMQQWLNTFAFHIRIAWWVYLLATGLTLFIALVAVSWQSLRVARSNPASHLRTE